LIRAESSRVFLLIAKSTGYPSRWISRDRRLAPPRYQTQPDRFVEALRGSGFQAMPFQQALRAVRRDAWKHRPPAGELGSAGTAQMKDFVADLKEQYKPLRAGAHTP